MEVKRKLFYWLDISNFLYIIVLLILAAVSIATLTGENGILTQAGDARDKTNQANAEEQVQVAVMGSYDNTGHLDYEKLEQNLKAIPGITGVPTPITDDSFQGDPAKFTVQVDGYSVDVYKDGNVEVGEGSKTPTPTEEKLAKEVLTIDPDAEEDYKKSPYVIYNGIKCRVFYNDTEHGLQIISADNMEEKVTLGYGDDKVTASDFDYEGSSAEVDENFKKAAASYNRAIDTLNEKAKTYKDDSGIVIDARCLGSIATLNEDGKFQLDDIASMYPSEGDTTCESCTTYNLDGKLKNTDTNYEEDAKDETTGQLQKLGLNATSETWLASRNVYAYSSEASFYVRFVYYSGNVSKHALCDVNEYRRPKKL